MDYDVLLCASSEDDDTYGRSLCSMMKDAHYRVWYAEQDLLGGGNRLQETGHVIERSKRTVCLLTENFINE